MNPQTSTETPAIISNQTIGESQLHSDVFEAIRCHLPDHYLLELKDKPLQTINHHLIPKPLVEEIRDNGMKAGLSYSFNAYHHKKRLEVLFQSGEGIPDFTMEHLRQNARIYLPGFYRGECRYHEMTLPSGMRDISDKTNIPCSTQKLIDKLKLEDFTAIVKTFPNTYFTQLEGYNIRYDALAQHYGLRTNLIDVTCEPFVAAFFATHRYNSDNETYQMVTDGIGCIKKAWPYLFLFPDAINGGIKSIIGLQQFKRPTLQRAFCWEYQQPEMNYSDDFHSTSESSNIEDISLGDDAPNQESAYINSSRINASQQQNVAPDNLNWSIIKFYQSRSMSQKIHNLFYDGDTCILFPDELISRAAKAVNKRKAVTIRSVYAVADELHRPVSEIVSELKSVEYQVVSSPAFRLSPADFNRMCREIDSSSLFEWTKVFKRPIYLGDGDSVFEPDNSYSTFNVATLQAIYSLFVLGNDVFKLS